MFLYLANYVSSDALFVGLSLLWLTELIWIINRPDRYQILLQALLFIIAFTFRYNAMYYPILAALAFIYSKQKLSRKILGVAIGPVLMIGFIQFSRQATYKMVGTPEFPPILGGWQWANNALYMREYIDVDTLQFPSKETADLDKVARNFFRTLPSEYRELSAYVANYFIRESKAPLKQYMDAHYNITGARSEVVAWGKVAPVFGQYGLFLIKRHPLAYLRYYVLLNTKNYFLPPLEKLEVYNLGEDNISPIGRFWFDFPDEKVNVVSKTFQGTLLLIYPMLFLSFNGYFLWMLVLFLRNYRKPPFSPLFSASVVLISGFILLNFLFSVTANIIVIRYQIFPMIVCLSFALLLNDRQEILETAELGTSPKEGFAEITQPLQPKLS
jgi:hypothetical protein